MEVIINCLVFLLGIGIGLAIVAYLDSLKITYTAPAPKTKEKIEEKDEKWDVVYVLSNDINTHCEELRYSLRSLENFNYNRVWFVGGEPKKLTPDKSIYFTQIGEGRYLKVYNSLKQICNNPEITENFWLFNDDFFILKKYNQSITSSCGDLYEHIVVHEDYYGKDTPYSRMLRYVTKDLRTHNLNTNSFEVHMPMLFNKEKLRQLQIQFPDQPMFRSLYGNYYNIDYFTRDDCKIWDLKDAVPTEEWDMVSTTADSFKVDAVGRYIRKKFPNKSRFEK